ncbi:MAG: hypothetical protein Q7U53_07355 [Anaerolineaceae bacterium]|nr:hypothetical protein [Anaerolineaceae bacterium]
MPKKTFTIEQLLYLLMISLGLFVRFINLGDLPLSDSEAKVSLAALSLISGNYEGFLTDQIFLANILGILFYLFGHGDVVARFFPAAIGSVFILTPALFRNYFDRRILVILSFWIAISPTFVSMSRQVDSSILFLFSITLFVFFFIKKSASFSAIFLVVSLLCGKVFFWNLVPVVVSMIYVYFFSNRNEYSPIIQILERVKEFHWKKFGIYFLGSYALISTFVLIFPRQFSGLGNSFVSYLEIWSLPSITIFSDLVRGLFFYEIAAIVFGLFGMVLILRKNQFAGLFLIGIMTFTTVQIILVAEKNIVWNIWIVLPLMISGSYFINKYVSLPKYVSAKIVIISLISLAILFFISLAFMSMFSNVNQINQDNSLRVFFIVAGFALIIGAGLLVGWAISWEIAGKSFLFLFISYFFIFTISASWNASGLRHPFYNEILRINEVPIESNLLISTLQDYSEWNYGDKNTLKIFVVNYSKPSLIWSLRNFSNVNYVSVIPQFDSIDAIITDVNQNVVQGNAFRGQEILWTSKPAWKLMISSELTQWFLTRRAPQDMLFQQSLIVWIRNDLFPGTETN